MSPLSHYQNGWNAAIEGAAKELNEMTRASAIQLAAGSMTASELRSVQAIVGMLLRKVRGLKIDACDGDNGEPR